MSAEKRAWLYRVMLAAGLLAAGYGLVSDTELPLWLGLGGALLGTGTATVYTPRPAASAPRHRAGADHVSDNR